MASPLSRGLFHRAIGESGPLGMAPTPRLHDAEMAGASLAEKLHAPAAGTLAFLRSLPPADLLKAGRGVSLFTQDGWVFPSPPLEVWYSHRELPASLIIGSNAVEFPAVGSPAELMDAMRRTFAELAPRAFKLYGVPGDGRQAVADPLYGDAADQFGSDCFRCPAIIEGGWHSEAGNPVWEYEFDRAIPPRPRVGHSSELPYVFGNLYATGSQGGSFQSADRMLSETLQAYWTNFAKTGDPNGPGLPIWPRYDPKGRNYIDFTKAADVTLGQNQRGPFCELFREVLVPAAAAR